MNPHDDPSPTLDDPLIDRLVDGEMEGEARRALLERLDVEPDGWRRLALAFLEAQCWREAFAPMVTCPSLGARGAVAPPTPALPHKGGGRQRGAGVGPRGREILPPPAQRGGGPGWGAARPYATSETIRAGGVTPARRLRLDAGTAIAAGLLVAFVLGRASAPARERVAAPAVAHHAATQAPAVPEKRTDGGPRPPHPEDRAPAGLASEETPKADPAPAAPEAHRIQVSRSPAPIPRRPAPLPPYVVGQLERQGYRVERRQGVMAVGLKDGRRAAIPVDAVKVRFVGQPLS